MSKITEAHPLTCGEMRFCVVYPAAWPEVRDLEYL